VIRLPGLRGDDPLGFLAALGLSSLSELGYLPELKLSWSTDGAVSAKITGVDSLDQLKTLLTNAFERIRSEGNPLPHGWPDFPPRKQGVKGSDPFRLPPEAMARYFTKAEQAGSSGAEHWPGRWLIALSCQLSRKPKGDLELTPFYAPTGQMTLRGSVLDAVASAVGGLGSPVDALIAWRRVRFDGANFDHRAIRDGAVATNGTPLNQGAPSPTWLATMALSMFPLVDLPGGSRAVGWQRAWLYPGYTTRSLIWPVWRHELSAAAIRVLIAHEALELTNQVQNERTPPRLRSDRALPGLGVFAVFGASRRTLSQGDGPLGPAIQLWPR